MELKRKLIRLCGTALKTVQIVLVLAIFSGASAQTNKPQVAMNTIPSTDAEKVADALRAGPSFITKDATILDWPSTKGGEYRVLRKGTSEWACLPAFPGYSHDEPGCFDPAFLSWVKQSLAGQEPRIEEMIAATPARRSGTVDEVADAVLYFLNATNFVTGQVLAVDGGLSQR